jgi:TM2 domain-containing membrane protein YozV
MSTFAQPNPQAIFYQHYEAVRRDELVGVLLALFLGSFGLHHFYMRRTGLGILYCCFFWCGIPGLLGFIECFFMPGRVREYNAIQAAAIAASLGIPVPAWGHPAAGVPPPGAIPATPPPGAMATVLPPMAVPPPGAMIACPRCQQANVVGSRFCASCGNAL